MAIEKIEIPSGTTITAEDDTVYKRRHKVWLEGYNYIDNLKKVFEKTALFNVNGFRYELPADPLEGDSSTYNIGSNYKLWCSVGSDEESEEIFAIGPNGFTATDPTTGVTTYAIGARIYVKYALGEYTYTDQQYIAAYRRANIDLAYVTSNGVLMRNVLSRASGTDPSSAPVAVVPIMIAKSNGKYPMIMAGGLGSSGSASNYDTDGPKSHNAVLVANYGDQQYFRTYLSTDPGHYNVKQTFPFMTSAKQSELVPFAGYGKAEEYTYTAKGFWIPVASSTVRSGGLHQAHINGKNFVTDGYWALQDG